MTTNGYKYLTLNLAQSLKAAGVPWKLCIICVDKDSATFLRGQGVDCIVYSEQIQAGQMAISEFNSDSFHRITRFKITIMNEFITNPLVKGLVFLDGDITVKKDFVPHLKDSTEAGLLYFQCDENSDAPCSCEDNCPNFCTGFIVYRKAEDKSVEHPFTINQSLWNTCRHDQDYLQQHIRNLGQPFKTLDRQLYPNGKMIKHALDPFIRHYNYRVGSSKKNAMKVRGDWFLPY